MTTPNEKNLASGTIAESISASSTTILVYVGEGGATTIKGVWPTTPFYATIMPSNPNAGVANSLDSEIVLVTAVGNDQVGNTALTVTRGQRGTTTKAYAEGDIVTAGIYAEDAVLLGEDGTAENPSPWIDPSAINLQYMTARGNYADTSVSANSLIALTNATSNGPFTLNNSHIIVGAGISRVMVSANAFYSSGGSAYAWYKIMKNDANTTPDTTTIANIVSSSYCSATISPIIVDVQEGDTFSLFNLEGNCKLRGTNTWLTVIAVG